jgi:hypothetical protein
VGAEQHSFETSFKENRVRIYNHQPDSDTTVIDDIEETATVASLLEVADTDYVFLDDDDEPIRIDVAIVEVLRGRGREPGHHHHIHRHSCRTITVSVTYGGALRRILAAPNTPVATITTEALTAFQIDPVTGADLVLRVPGSDSDLSDSTCIGSLTHGRDCAADLNLLPAHREAG